MSLNKSIENAPLRAYVGPERRRHIRLEYDFPAKVQGVGADGNPFDLEISINNVSACGFYTTLPVVIGRGAKLSTTIRFSAVPAAGIRPKFLSVHATVRHASTHPDGTCAVGVEFEHHLFL